MSDFFDTSGLEDMIDEINSVAEGLEMAPDIVKEVLEQYLPLWKRLAPIDSGKLRRSISIVASGGNYGISMLDYGWFNLYGVKPNGRTPFRAISVPTPRRQPMPSLLKGDFYRYGNRQYGLPATVFMPQLQSEESFSEFVDQIFNIIEQRIIQAD
jgi:hypothetical protein